MLGAGAAEPGCRYGEGDCPPEDCGGPPGYALLLTALADPAHPEHARLRAWAGEPAPFEQAATDELVRQTAGVVPDSVRLVLELAAGGVKLTPGGRLPRVFVRQVQQARPDWAWSERPASREEDLIPLLVLHDVLREVGLLRLTKGVLIPIKAGADDRQVVRRLRSWFSTDRFTELLAGLIVALLVRSGGSRSAELSSEALPLLGPRWQVEGEPLNEEVVRMEISRLSSVLRALDLIDGTKYPIWTPGPSARTLLPQATALVWLWDRTGSSV